MIRLFKIGNYERGLLFRDGDFVDVLKPGRYVYFDPLFKLRVDVEDVTVPALTAPWLDVIVDSGALKDEAVVVDLADGERALVWIEGRLADVLTPGLYAYWTVMKNVRIERVDAPTVRFESLALAKVLTLPRTAHLLSSSTSTRVRSVCSP